jgi:hypothetical protein
MQKGDALLEELQNLGTMVIEQFQKLYRDGRYF